MDFSIGCSGDNRPSETRTCPQLWPLPDGEPQDFVVESPNVTMWLDRAEWAGTPIDRKDCIPGTAPYQGGRRVELALTPENGLQFGWDALVKSGSVRAKYPVREVVSRLAGTVVSWSS